MEINIFEVFIMINKYLAWLIFILFSIVILGQILNKGCLTISMNTIWIIILGCSIIIGLSDWYFKLRESV